MTESKKCNHDRELMPSVDYMGQFFCRACEERFHLVKVDHRPPQQEVRLKGQCTCNSYSNSKGEVHRLNNLPCYIELPSQQEECKHEYSNLALKCFECGDSRVTTTSTPKEPWEEQFDEEFRETALDIWDKRPTDLRFKIKSYITTLLKKEREMVKAEILQKLPERRALFGNHDHGFNLSLEETRKIIEGI